MHLIQSMVIICHRRRSNSNSRNVTVREWIHRPVHSKHYHYRMPQWNHIIIIWKMEIAIKWHHRMKMATVIQVASTQTDMAMVNDDRVWWTKKITSNLSFLFFIVFFILFRSNIFIATNSSWCEFIARSTLFTSTNIYRRILYTRSSPKQFIQGK